jgi:site-specific recombinase XerD
VARWPVGAEAQSGRTSRKPATAGDGGGHNSIVGQQQSEDLVGEFESWLIKVRKRARTTTSLYVRHVAALAEFARERDKSLVALTARDLRRYVEVLRERAPASTGKLRLALESFYDFLEEAGGASQSPLSEVDFGEPLEPKRVAPSAVREALQRLSPSHRLIALFVSELRASGVEITEIFQIEVPVPVPQAVEGSSKRHGRRAIRLSENARVALEWWGGSLPIGARAFQRALERAGVSPKLLGDRGHPGPADKDLAEMSPDALEGRLREMDRERVRRAPHPDRWPVLAEFEAWLRERRSLADNTVELYVRGATQLVAYAAARSKDPARLSADEVQDFLESFSDRSVRTQANLRYPLQSFYAFVSDAYGRMDDPTGSVVFMKPPSSKPRPRRQVGHLLAKLSKRNRQLALFVSELREAGVGISEIFEIDERPPVPARIRVKGGRAGPRTVMLSEQARGLSRSGEDASRSAHGRFSGWSRKWA